MESWKEDASKWAVGTILENSVMRQTVRSKEFRATKVKPKSFGSHQFDWNAKDDLLKEPEEQKPTGAQASKDCCICVSQM